MEDESFLSIPQYIFFCGDFSSEDTHKDSVTPTAEQLTDSGMK